MENKIPDAVKSIWDSLTEEQKEKVRACKDMNELTELAGKEGIELPDEVLDAVAGGYVINGSIAGETTYVVIDNDGGVHEIYYSLEAAKAKARSYGYSDELIDEAKLKKIRGRC